MRYARQNKILELIKENDIDTQEMLVALLKESGFNVTQATISRDIRELKLTKITTPSGKPKYAQQPPQDTDIWKKYRQVLAAGILTMETSENLIVIKTVSGVAMAVAAALDNLDISGLMGCIAGDDTIIAVARSKEMSEKVIANIEKAAYSEF